MLKLILSLGLMGCFSQLHAQTHLRQSVSLARQTLQSLPQLTKPERYCRKNAPEKRCPEVLLNSLQDLYDEGWVLGAVDRVFNDGKFRSPRHSCDSAAKYTQSIAPGDVHNQLQQAYPKHRQIRDYSIQCASQFKRIGVPPEERELAKTYLMTDFNAKQHILEKKIKSVLGAKLQSKQALDQSLSSCNEYNGKVKELCLEQQKCFREKDSNFLESKVRQLSVAGEGLAKLYQKRKELLPQSQSRGRPDKTKKLKRVEKSIDKILALNPILKSESFAEVQQQFKKGQKVPHSQVQKNFKDYLKQSLGKLDGKIQKLSRANNCLLGHESQCAHFSKTLGEDTFADASKVLFNETNQPLTELNRAHSFYQCAESQKRNHEQTDEILTDSAISSFLTLTPMLAINAVKVASNAGKFIKSAAQAQKATRTVEGSAYAGDLAYGGYHTQKIYRECKASQNIVKSLENSSSQSCQDQKKHRLAASNSSQCATQLLLSAALMTPVKLQSLKIFKPTRKAQESLPLSQRDETLGEILLNSRLSDSARVQKAAKTLNLKKLTTKQKQALLKAHNYGQGSVFNYTKAELKEKNRLLRESFSKEQASKLLRRGLAGKESSSVLNSTNGKYALPEAPYSFDNLHSLKGKALAPKQEFVFRGDAHNFRTLNDIEQFLHRGLVKNSGRGGDPQRTMQVINNSNETLTSGNPKKWATIADSHIKSGESPLISASTDVKLASQFTETGEGLPVVIKMRAHEEMVDLSRLHKQYPEETQSVFGSAKNAESEVYLPGGIDPKQIESVAVLDPNQKGKKEVLFFLSKQDGKVVCRPKGGSCPDKFR